MSLDPRKLCREDNVRFGARLIRRVGKCYECTVEFEDGHSLDHRDPMWELAELVDPVPPAILRSAELNRDGTYSSRRFLNMSPEYLLHTLKGDVEELEEAGIVDRWGG